MSGALRMRRERMRLLNGSDSAGSQTEVALSHRVETLKKVALTLMREVEALADAQAVDAKHSMNLYDEVQRFEKELIQRALERTGGHQTRAAQLLGVKVTTLNSKIKRYNISSYNVGADTAGAQLEAESSSRE